MQSELICSTCGSRTTPRKVTKGSLLIELILWCCFVIPGLIYTVWRRTNRPRVCGACGAATLVPLNTPVGQKLAAEHPSTGTIASEERLSVPMWGRVVLTVVGGFVALFAIDAMLRANHVDRASYAAASARPTSAPVSPVNSEDINYSLEENAVVGIDPSLAPGKWTQADMQLSKILMDVITHHGGRCNHVDAFRRFTMGHGIVVLCGQTPEQGGTSYTLMLYPQSSEIDLITPDAQTIKADPSDAEQSISDAPVPAPAIAESPSEAFQRIVMTQGKPCESVVESHSVEGYPVSIGICRVGVAGAMTTYMIDAHGRVQELPPDSDTDKDMHETRMLAIAYILADSK